VQLGLNLPNLVCVDAMGLQLNSDHLHLTTNSQVKLGKMLAEAYIIHFSVQFNSTFWFSLQLKMSQKTAVERNDYINNCLLSSSRRNRNGGVILLVVVSILLILYSNCC
jgi:Carbohydrate esterase, sialic acid-specific acetylesterase